MRTTLTINDDVLEEVRKRAETDGESIGQTVSALLRKALHADAPPIRYPSGFEPLPPRPGTISRDAQVRPYPARRAPMRPPLPDVNVPGSPVDSMQVRHRRAMEWFMSSGQSCWTTFPTTQNGAVLIISGTRHLQTGLPPAMAIEVVRNLTQVGDPRFLPEGISLPEPAPYRCKGVRQSSDVTDSYLLAVAASADANLATFDRRISAAAIPDGQDRIFVIP